ncbi:MAG: hypothetical protein Q9219_001586 [cf. Caloplaca sp. 3 TL-2023]
MSDLQRLYISPLDPKLLSIILPEPARQSARNISYHTLQTFPEKRYGYLDLPPADADRLKKKLQGSILRGTKMKVEQARSEHTKRGSRGAAEDGSVGRTKQEKKSKTISKREDGVLPGMVLPEDRKVKRGWTEPAAQDKKKPKKNKKPEKHDASIKPSAYTDGPECLFKAKAPANAGGNMPEDTAKATKPKKRKRGDAEGTLVVHEFEKTMKYPTFLRSESGAVGKKPASAYVDGKGWIDEDGEVVEAEQSGRRTRSKGTRPKNDSHAEPKDVRREASMKGNANHPKKPKGEAHHPDVHDETSSSGGSSPDNEEDIPEEGKEPLKQSRESASSIDDDSQDNAVNTDQVRALSISTLSPTPPLEPSKEVHPLEALFKRPQSAASQTPRKPPLEVRTEFSFFDPDTEKDDVVPSVMPQTPFTQQDFQQRRLRSAAPTPDTAAPSKTNFGNVWSQDSGGGNIVSDEDGDEGQSTHVDPVVATKKETDGEVEESEFTKWFYEHRGETNRAWKRRRREAAKEKRQKENKRR